MKKKSLLTIATLAIIMSGCNSSPSTSTTTVVGAATDDYIINGDVKFYKLNGTKIDNSCKTGNFGLFSCDLQNISEDEKLIIVVNSGKIDKDGDSATTDDEITFDGSLIALSSADKGTIISPLTSKIVADTIGATLIVDEDRNLSYIGGTINIDSIKANLLSSDSNTIISATNNLASPHILQTKDMALIKEQAVTITQMLDKNISMVDSVDTSGDAFRLQILHINDTHSHLESTKISIYPKGIKTYVYAGGYAKIAKFIKDTKSADSHAIALHAGDSVQGTLYYTLFDGKADIEALNQMNLDAMTIGNHEFDKGADDFAQDFASKANFAIVSCDIDAQNNPELKNIIKPYIIKEIDKEKVAIVGDSIDSSVISSPGPTIEFSNYITSAQNAVDELQDKGINKIIFLTHIGYDNDKVLAQSVADIDIIVGGHSHTLLGNFSNLGLTGQGEYPTIIKNSSNETLIVTSWKWGEIVGDINVVFDNDGAVEDYSGTPVMLIDDTFLRKNAEGETVEVNSSIKTEIESQIASMADIRIEAKDSTVQSIINKYKPQVDELMTTTIAQANTNLINVRLPGDTDTQTGMLLPNGSMIAPHIALAMYEKAKEIGGCDFALQNVGGVRISIPEGNITIGEIYTLLPFGNTLITLKMDGHTIVDMLEDAIDRSLILKTDTGAFPYLGGAKITINKENEKGKRVVDFKLKDKDGEWINFDKSKTYTIATNSYIANGGDYYEQMCSVTDRVDTGYIDAEIFMEYAKRKQHLDALDEDELPVIMVNSQ